MSPTTTTEISLKGRMVQVPSLTLDARTIICRKNIINIASIHDEFFLPGEAVPDPEYVIAQLRAWSLKPDLFTFCQKVDDPVPKHSYFFEYDNFAVLPITTYEDWLKNHAKKDVKENLRRAAREGVIVKSCVFDDTFAASVKSLYDETPVRQGRAFWHYNKPLENVRKENGTYCDRSEYIGAYFGEELIGFLKMVYVGSIAKTMQVITKDRYFSKRPANAMIAKAVEVCAEKQIKYFNYGPFDYPGKKDNSLTEFKKRHGFSKVLFPRYYIPLSFRGRMYLALGLQHGFKRMIPTTVLNALLLARSETHRRWLLPLRRIGRRNTVAVNSANNT